MLSKRPSKHTLAEDLYLRARHRDARVAARLSKLQIRCSRAHLLRNPPAETTMNGARVRACGLPPPDMLLEQAKRWLLHLWTSTGDRAQPLADGGHGLERWGGRVTGVRRCSRCGSRGEACLWGPGLPESSLTCGRRAKPREAGLPHAALSASVRAHPRGATLFPTRMATRARVRNRAKPIASPPRRLLRLPRARRRPRGGTPAPTVGRTTITRAASSDSRSSAPCDRARDPRRTCRRSRGLGTRDGCTGHSVRPAAQTQTSRASCRLVCTPSAAVLSLFDSRAGVHRGVTSPQPGPRCDSPRGRCAPPSSDEEARGRGGFWCPDCPGDPCGLPEGSVGRSRARGAVRVARRIVRAHRRC